MPLLHYQVGDRRLVIFLQLPAGLPHGDQLLGKNSKELALATPVPEHNNLLRLPPVVLLIEFLQKMPRHVLHVLDNFLVALQSHVLDPDLHLVVDRPGFHTGHHSSNAGLEPSALRSWMGYIGTHDHDWPLENLGSAHLGQHVVDSSQLGVDLHADIGNHLLAPVAALVQVRPQAALGGDFQLQIPQVLDLVLKAPSLRLEDDEHQPRVYKK